MARGVSLPAGSGVSGAHQTVLIVKASGSTKRRSCWDNPQPLHEELTSILTSEGNRWMTTEELAAEVNVRGRYQKRDQSAVTAFQVHGRPCWPVKNVCTARPRGGAAAMEVTTEVGYQLVAILVVPNRHGVPARRRLPARVKVRGAWNIARAAGFTEPTGLGLDRLRVRGKPKRDKSDRTRERCWGPA